MLLTVNGERQEISEASLNVSRLIVLNKVADAAYVTVQVNGDILDRSQFDTTTLKDRDEVDFLYFMGGGSQTFVSGGAR